MPVTVTCIECGTKKSVLPYRAESFKFCGFNCRSIWRGKHWTGENNPAFTGGVRSKNCQRCGKEFSHKAGSTYATFKTQKFCSKPCADVGGKRYFGPENANWNGNPRRKHRESKQAAWARAVISRDLATCQKCGATDIELQAHHVQPYAEHPERRWDISNGLTVCAPCHWQIHATTENAVNSGKPVTGGADGNPEPSYGRKPVEGATTRGRAYRRWNGNCEFCGVFISRRWSDTKGKAHLFCSKTCSGKFRAGQPQFSLRRPRQ